MEVWKHDVSFRDLKEQLTSDRCAQACEVQFTQDSCGSIVRSLSHFLTRHFLVTTFCFLTTAVTFVLLYLALPYYALPFRIPLLLSLAVALQAILAYLHKVRCTSAGMPPLARDLQEAVCPHCARLKVERASHCFTCGLCTLRMDRHSCEYYTDLLGCCVGLNNARYFFLWLYWLAVGSAVAACTMVYPALAEKDMMISWILRTALGICSCVRTR